MVSLRLETSWPNGYDNSIFYKNNIEIKKLSAIKLSLFLITCTDQIECGLDIKKNDKIKIFNYSVTSNYIIFSSEE